jgi:flavin-dependent dehydrogenase
MGTTRKEVSTEILIVGGGLGGVSAALAATRLGRKVVLVEELDRRGYRPPS